MISSINFFELLELEKKFILFWYWFNSFSISIILRFIIFISSIGEIVLFLNRINLLLKIIFFISSFEISKFNFFLKINSSNLLFVLELLSWFISNHFFITSDKSLWLFISKFFNFLRKSLHFFIEIFIDFSFLIKYSFFWLKK